MRHLPVLGGELPNSMLRQKGTSKSPNHCTLNGSCPIESAHVGLLSSCMREILL